MHSAIFLLQWVTNQCHLLVFVQTVQDFKKGGKEGRENIQKVCHVPKQREKQIIRINLLHSQIIPTRRGMEKKIRKGSTASHLRKIKLSTSCPSTYFCHKFCHSAFFLFWFFFDGCTRTATFRTTTTPG